MTFDRYAFWKNPGKSGLAEAAVAHCRPEFYLDLVNVTGLIVSTISRYAEPGMTVLELGCGTGRNLVALQEAGYGVAGVEISERTVDVGRDRFPLYKDIPVILAPVESVIKDLGRFDVVFTSGLLMHLPHELEWVIGTMARKARHMVMTNEGERDASFHAWPHDYRALIEAEGWTQVEMTTGEEYPPLPATTVKRVFLRAADGD